MEPKELVISVMTKANKPLKTSEITAISGLDAKEVDKVIKKLKSEEIIESPIRCFWALK